MNPNGPYVAVASLCDLVLHEKQENQERISCIRFLDTITADIPADAPDPLPPLTLQVNGLISFRSGSFVGSKTLTLIVRSPEGKPGKAPMPTYPMQFGGGGQAAANL